MWPDRPTRGRRRAHVLCLAAVVLALAAACGGSSASPTAAGASPTPAAPSVEPSPATNGHCAITPDATAAATVKWNIEVEGGNPTIKAGEAVAFVTRGNERPTVTEGTKGVAVADPCIDKVLSSNSPVLVTFAKPGVYNIFCRKEPTTMFTTVTVT